jgi:protein phosphatase methylesterase 1
MTIVPPDDAHRGAIPIAAWKDYFEQELSFENVERQAEYHVYFTQPRDVMKDPLFVCHHGAGSSGLSFACFAKALKRKVPGAGVLSVDARDHGSIVVRGNGSQNTDFSLEALAGDLHAVVKLTQSRMQWAELPKLVLLGHSLGGAVVTRLAKEGSFGAKLVGFCVIDVVEGSAIEALLSMKEYLSTRPPSFPSLDAAIMWHVRSRTIRNYESAHVSTSGLVVETKPGSWTWRTNLASKS